MDSWDGWSCGVFTSYTQRIKHNELNSDLVISGCKGTKIAVIIKLAAVIYVKVGALVWKDRQ